MEATYYAFLLRLKGTDKTSQISKKIKLDILPPTGSYLVFNSICGNSELRQIVKVLIIEVDSEEPVIYVYADEKWVETQKEYDEYATEFEKRGWEVGPEGSHPERL